MTSKESVPRVFIKNKETVISKTAHVARIKVKKAVLSTGLVNESLAQILLNSARPKCEHRYNTPATPLQRHIEAFSNSYQEKKPWSRAIYSYIFFYPSQILFFEKFHVK